MISQYRTSLHTQNNYVDNNYYSRTEPAFFIEPITQDDFATIFLHHHLKIIVWNHDSLDTMIQYNLLQKIKACTNIYHIAYIMSVSEKLENYKIDHFHLPNFIDQYIPLVNTNNNMNKETRKKSDIYLILSNDIKMYQNIINKFPNLTFIINKNTTIPPSLLENKNVKSLYILNAEIDLPETCFLSINLGNKVSSDIYKLGKRGINTINNEGTPYSLEYTDIISIYKIIMNEMIESTNYTNYNKDSIIEDQINYNEMDFYQYPFEKHGSVCLTYLSKDLYKIRNTSSGASLTLGLTGIYTRHYLNLGKKYLIKIRGYRLFDTTGGNVVLWIAQDIPDNGSKKQKQTILLDNQNALPGTYRECGVINYIFHNTIAENNFYIGLLFQHAKENDEFIMESLKVLVL